MTDDELLADMLLRWEELHGKGQEPTAEELCRDSPHLAPLLTELIKALKVTAWMERPDNDGGIQPDPATPSAPRTLADRYRLDEKIAEGGFALVWKGFDLELRRAVAVKMPKAGRLLSTERFMAEARRVAGLNHPGVVPVFDVGRDGETCFIVSEFVEGGSLADRIAKDRPNSQVSARLIAEVAETLAYPGLFIGGRNKRSPAESNLLSGQAFDPSVETSHEYTACLATTAGLFRLAAGRHRAVGGTADQRRRPVTRAPVRRAGGTDGGLRRRAR